MIGKIPSALGCSLLLIAALPALGQNGDRDRLPTYLPDDRAVAPKPETVCGPTLDGPSDGDIREHQLVSPPPPGMPESNGALRSDDKLRLSPQLIMQSVTDGHMECACPTKTTGYEIQWLDRQVPTPQLKLRPEAIPGVHCSAALDWATQQDLRRDLVLRPREILKEVVCHRYKPVQQVDPCTGCATTILEPVTEVRTIKEIVYDAVTEEKVSTVRLPMLRPDYANYQRLVAECSAEPQRERYGLLVPCEIYERPQCPKYAEPSSELGEPAK